MKEYQVLALICAAMYDENGKIKGMYDVGLCALNLIKLGVTNYLKNVRMNQNALS